MSERNFKRERERERERESCVLVSDGCIVDYTVSSLGRRQSSTSMKNDGNAIDEAHEKIFSFVPIYMSKFCNQMVQALVQSRQNEKHDTIGESSGVSKTWFSLEQEEIGEVTVHLKKSVPNYPPNIPSFSVDFILYTADGETLPLETWCLAYEHSVNPFQSSSGRISPSTVADTKSKFYRDLGILLRTVLVTARMTPMHRYYVKKQGVDTFIITYRVLEGRSQIDLGPEFKRKEVGNVAAPFGTFYLSLAYRTRMEIDRAPSPGSNQSFQGIHISPGTSPAVAGTPSSFCDVLSTFSTSPASMAMSPSSRSRAVSEATSEGGGSVGSKREKRPSGSSLGGRREEPEGEARSENRWLENEKGDEQKEEVEEKDNEEEDSDDDELCRSRLTEKEMRTIPFANLLMSSYTGVLHTYGLSAEAKARLEIATSMRVEKGIAEPDSSTVRSRCDSTVIPEEETLQESDEASGEKSTINGKASCKKIPPRSLEEEPEDVVEYGGLSEELTDSIMMASTNTVKATTSMSATLTGREKGGGDEMTCTLRGQEESTVLRRSLLSLRVDDEVFESGNGGKEGSEESEESDDEDEDSFVRISPFYADQPDKTDEQSLADMIVQLKAYKKLEGSAGYSVQQLREVADKELPQFDSLKENFDQLVAEVTEAVEEEERREREGNYFRRFL